MATQRATAYAEVVDATEPLAAVLVQTAAVAVAIMYTLAVVVQSTLARRTAPP